MNKTVGLDIAKWNLFFMKPNNLTSLRRMSRVRLAWREFLSSKLTTSWTSFKDSASTLCFVVFILLGHSSTVCLFCQRAVMHRSRSKIHDTEALVRAVLKGRRERDIVRPPAPVQMTELPTATVFYSGI